MNPRTLERFSFLWSEARLFIAAIALLIGGTPPLRALVPFDPFSGLVTLVLILAWIISGLASLYLLYRWNKGGQHLFGKRDTWDTVAFGVSIISGINLGIVGVSGHNIGMSITTNYMVFILVAGAYAFSAVYLYRRWARAGERLFGRS